MLRTASIALLFGAFALHAQTRLEPRAVPEGQVVRLDSILVQGSSMASNASLIDPDPGPAELSGIQLSRTFLEAVQGNLDRETVERGNGESL